MNLAPNPALTSLPMAAGRCAIKLPSASDLYVMRLKTMTEGNDE